jgi:hypothetical protein
VLDSYALIDEDNFVYPCYVQGSDVPLIVKMNGVTIAELANTAFMMNGTIIAQSGGFGYELMTYATAQLTAASKYTLKATGAGNKLRRAVFNAPDNTGLGIDHPAGQRFAFLWPSGYRNSQGQHGSDLGRPGAQVQDSQLQQLRRGRAVAHRSGIVEYNTAHGRSIHGLRNSHASIDYQFLRYHARPDSGRSTPIGRTTAALRP